jgi:hypothetical protein
MTALTYMASAARPQLSDARVPCPLCGGLIHPVAGRCKHCKQDLSTFRSGRAAAATPLPALAGHGNGVSNGHAAVAAAPVAVPVAVEPSQPILPPRPTGRSIAAQPQGGLARHWPMIVIILALVAIATAVTIMMWPTSRNEGKHALQPPPAPERMETNPLPPPSGSTQGTTPPQPGDPWGPHSQTDPRPAPRQMPDPVPNPDPDDDVDVLGGIVGGTAGGTLGGGGFSPFGTSGLGATDFLTTAMGHACDRLLTCPDADTLLVQTCGVVSHIPKHPLPSCPEAQRCIDKLDKMSCSQNGGFASPMSVVAMIGDCTAAANC